jgi:hypothetical protein
MIQTNGVSGIVYRQGNLFHKMPSEGEIVIAHVCNNIGAYDAGFARSLALKFPKAKAAYLEFYKNGIDDQRQFCYAKNSRGDLVPNIGMTQIVEVEEDNRDRITYVANMIAQEGLRSETNPIPIKYDALEKCMKAVVHRFRSKNKPEADIICPKFGSGLAGGDWNTIETMVNKLWISEGFSVTVFEL